MKISSIFPAISVLLLAMTLHAQLPPPSADAIMNEARQEAAKVKKNVFIIFHASWCVWCRRMDSSMNDPACKKFFDENFIIRHLVVDESKGKKNLENPRADEFRKKYGGDGVGIPYWLIFDKDGKLLADSKIRPPEGDGFDTPGDNSGCPATEKEVTFFITVLKKTSHLNSGEQAIIEKRFRENEH